MGHQNMCRALLWKLSGAPFGRTLMTISPALPFRYTNLLPYMDISLLVEKAMLIFVLQSFQNFDTRAQGEVQIGRQG